MHHVTRVIASLYSKYVKFPRTQREQQNTMYDFYAASKLPGVIGAIDCTHVPIQSPGGDDAEIYRNRKGYFSINVQLVCDQQYYISDAVVRWPGSVHDSTIFDHCRLRAELENHQLGEGYLVGDGGYACRQYVLTPLSNPLTEPEKAFNRAQISARNCIERTNGILKRRFPALKYGLRVRVDNALPVITATIVLHNIAVMVGEEDAPDDQELHQFVASQHNKLCVDYDPVKVSPPAGIQQVTSTSVRQAVIDGHFTN